jgi:hypothetical protein
MAQKRKSPPRKRSAPKGSATPKSRINPSLAILIEELLSLLRSRDPRLRDGTPLPPGKVGPELPFPKPIFDRMILAAAMQGNQGSIIWTQHDSELQVITGKITVDLSDGIILVNLPVFCDQASGATVQVPFAVGGPTSPAGMHIATEEYPRGPDAVIAVWSEALLAYAWKLLMTVVTRAAALAGTDTDGAALVPVAITASADSVQVLTMARHTFDRVVP